MSLFIKLMTHDWWLQQSLLIWQQMFFISTWLNFAFWLLTETLVPDGPGRSWTILGQIVPDGPGRSRTAGLFGTIWDYLGLWWKNSPGRSRTVQDWCHCQKKRLKNNSPGLLGTIWDYIFCQASHDNHVWKVPTNFVEFLVGARLEQQSKATSLRNHDSWQRRDRIYAMCIISRVHCVLWGFSTLWVQFKQGALYTRCILCIVHYKQGAL